MFDEDEVVHIDLVGKRKVYNEAQYNRVVAENTLLREALEECKIEIDNYIDADFPIGAHPLFAKKNANYKRCNPARIALHNKVGKGVE